MLVSMAASSHVCGAAEGSIEAMRIENESVAFLKNVSASLSRAPSPAWRHARRCAGASKLKIYKMLFAEAALGDAPARRGVIDSRLCGIKCCAETAVTERRKYQHRKASLMASSQHALADRNARHMASVAHAHHRKCRISESSLPTLIPLGS